MLPEIPTEELAAVLDEVALGALARAKAERPPVDAFAVARALGLVVAMDDSQPGRARFVRLEANQRGTPQGSILLSPEPRPQRRQWAVAHEIGEHLAHQAFAALGIDPRTAPPGAREAIANHLAGRLLVPSAWLAVDGAAVAWNLLELRQRYPTASHELIARRMVEMPPSVVITIFDNDRLTFRRGNLPGHIPPPTAVERECRRLAHASGQPQSGGDSARTVQAWPIHEPDWRREIVRWEVGEMF